MQAKLSDASRFMSSTATASSMVSVRTLQTLVASLVHWADWTPGESAIFFSAINAKAFSN